MSAIMTYYSSPFYVDREKSALENAREALAHFHKYHCDYGCKKLYVIMKQHDNNDIWALAYEHGTDIYGRHEIVRTKSKGDTIWVMGEETILNYLLELIQDDYHWDGETLYPHRTKHRKETIIKLLRLFREDSDLEVNKWLYCRLKYENNLHGNEIWILTNGCRDICRGDFDTICAMLQAKQPQTRASQFLTYANEYIGSNGALKTIIDANKFIDFYREKMISDDSATELK